MQSTPSTGLCLLTVWCNHQFQEQQWPVQSFVTFNLLRVLSGWICHPVFDSDSIRIVNISLVQRTNAVLTIPKLSMLQVKCCQQQLKCNYCCFRSLETLVAAWKLLKQTITRYRPLPHLEYSTCATHTEGQTWDRWTRLWFRKGRCDGCTCNMQSKCRWYSWSAPIYSTVYIKKKHFGKA